MCYTMSLTIGAVTEGGPVLPEAYDFSTSLDTGMFPGISSGSIGRQWRCSGICGQVFLDTVLFGAFALQGKDFANDGVEMGQDEAIVAAALTAALGTRLGDVCIW